MNKVSTEFLHLSSEISASVVDIRPFGKSEFGGGQNAKD
jgi:hypothetical protein